MTWEVLSMLKDYSLNLIHKFEQSKMKKGDGQKFSENGLTEHVYVIW